MTATTFEGRYTDHFASLNGLRLHYTDWDGPSKRNVLLVHGLNVELHTWDPIAAQLADEFRPVAPDLRGHGESDWCRDGYPLAGFVSDLAELAKTLALAPFDYVGHSLGSRIGIAFAAEHPELVRRVVLSDTGPEVPREGALRVRTRVSGQQQARAFKTEEEALAYFRELNPDWLPIFHEIGVKRQLRRNWVGRLVFRADPELVWITGSASLTDVPYLWAAAARISAPTLILRGRTSHLLSEEIAERMRTTITNSRIVTFETGHYIPRQQPLEFANVIREFLREP